MLLTILSAIVLAIAIHFTAAFVINMVYVASDRFNIKNGCSPGFDQSRIASIAWAIFYLINMIG